MNWNTGPHAPAGAMVVRSADMTGTTPTGTAPVPSTPGTTHGYDAFISYSHAVDGRLAPALREGLHRFAKPWYRRRALRVFHDKASLRTTEDLWATIEAALGRSGAFILLASPESAASPWVGREVRFWRDHKPGRPILIVLTDGEIAWSQPDNDFDWTRTTALPRHLGGAFSGEPLWLDLRWARQEEQVSLRHPGFRDAIATLSAALREVDKDELLGDDIRLWRRTRRLAWSAVAGLTTLTLVAAGLGTFALIQLNEANRQTRIAVSRQLTAQADALAERRPDTSLLLSVEAMRRDPSATVRATLLDTLLSTHLTGLLRGHERGVSGLAVRPDGRTLATGDTDGVVLLSDLATHRQLASLRAPKIAEGSAAGVAFSPDGNTLAVVGDEVTLWDVTEPTQPTLLTTIGDASGPHGAAFTPDGRTLAIGTIRDNQGHGQVELWDTTDPARPRRRGSLLTPGYVQGIAVTRDGHTIAASDHRGRVTLGDLTNPDHPRQLAQIQGFGYAESGVAFSPDGTLLATGDATQSAVLWRVSDPARPRRIASLTGHRDAVFDLSFAPEGGRLVTAGKDGTALVWDLADPAHPTRLTALNGHDGPVASVLFAADGQLVTGGNDHTVRLWQVDPISPELAARLPLAEGASTRVARFPAQVPGPLFVGEYGDRDRVGLWDTTDPAHPRQLSAIPGTVGAAREPLTGLSRDGRLLALLADRDADYDYTAVTLWDVADPAHPIQRGRITDVPKGLHSLWMNPTGTVVTGEYYDENYDDRTTWWSVADPAAPRRLDRAPINAAPTGTSSQDGALVARLDFTAHLYRVTGGETTWLANLSVHRSGIVRVAFTPNGRYLFAATGTDKTTEVWDLRDPADPVLLTTLTEHTDSVLSVAVSGDGHLLVTGGADRTALLWDITDPAHPIRVGTAAPGGPVTDASFSADGRSLIIVAGERATLWDTSELLNAVADPVGRACTIAGPALPAADWSRYLPDEPYRASCD